MNEEPFADARLLLDRAKSHIDDLKVGIERFCTKDAWTIVVEPNLEETEYVHKFRVAKTSDPDLKILVYDASTKLKDALDHVAAECARLNGAQRIKNINLPFVGTAAKLDERFARQPMQHLPPKIRAYLRSLNTYSGGNDRLHVLSKLSGTNKHWVLIPTFPNLHAVKIIHFDGRQRIIQTNDWPTSPDDDLVLFTGPKPDIDYHLTMLLNVCFKGVPFLEGARPMPTLRYIASVVNDVINDCEAICRELGLISGS